MRNACKDKRALSFQLKERVLLSKTSVTFKINPINDDLIGLKNENAIARSIRNLILTVPGEKPFNPQIGCRVSALLFENFDSLTG